MSRRRYRFLNKDGYYTALNKLRSAFLAANDGKEVDKLILGILTHDERMKIGRRIQTAQMIKDGFTYQEIANELRVGKTTVINVSRKISRYPEAFNLIMKRENKVEKVCRKKAYHKTGSSKIVFKKKEYTGFKRKDVQR